jgi:hypothetical protein
MFQRGVGIESGQCWRIAQAMTIAADGELGYVEGVWTRSSENPWHGPDDKVEPAPHAWNSYKGHIIDLMAEFYRWRTFGEDSPWLHEPLKAYTVDDLHHFEDEFGHWNSPLGTAEASYSITEVINDEDPNGIYLGEEVFNDAKVRLLARINSREDKAA